MFITKRRTKWHLSGQPLDKVPMRWKIVIAGLIGSGTGLFILTMWSPGSKEQPSWNKTSELIPRIQLFGRVSGFGHFAEAKTSVYCKNSGCATVVCSLIPKSRHPGEVASDFIMRTFRIQCPNTESIEQLVFDSCVFPENKLARDWMTSSLPINRLTFRNCGLAELPRGSFSSGIFTNMKTLEITTEKIRVLKKWIFEELAGLNSLQIDDNIIYEAEYDLLHSVADSLEVLTLDGCIRDVQVLSNITSGDSLAKVQILSIQRNTISTITSEIFQATPNVVSLYLAKSEIKHFEADALTATRSLVLLDLKNNLLTTLPKQLFTSVLSKPAFKVWMTENPWDCSCDFQWIQEIIADYPGALKEIPKCESPARNALKYFTNAEFCEITTVTSITTDLTTGRTTEKIVDAGSTTEMNSVSTTTDRQIPNVVKFTCKNSEISIMRQVSRRTLLSINEWEYPSRFRDFFVKPLTDGNVWINVRTLHLGVSLIWFMNKASENDRSNSVNCVSNVKGPLLLTNLQRDCSYTVCLLEELGKAPSPFNCLGIKTHPDFQTDTWLTNEDKGIVLSIAISLLVVICIISVVSSCLVIRRNPSLLKGSKRVVMVRKRSVEALVLPHGTRVNEQNCKDPIRNSCTRIKPDPGYLTPLEMLKWTENSSPSQPRRKDSKISRVSSQYSGGSYVSGIEPSPTELANWRNNGRIRSYSICLKAEESEDSPPPLPPHRSKRDRFIPSLSMSIESNKDSVSYRTFCIDANEMDPANTRIQFVDGIM